MERPAGSRSLTRLVLRPGRARRVLPVLQHVPGRERGAFGQRNRRGDGHAARGRDLRATAVGHRRRPHRPARAPARAALLRSGRSATRCSGPRAASPRSSAEPHCSRCSRSRSCPPRSRSRSRSRATRARTCFGRMRVWGTVGFLLLVASFPRRSPPARLRSPARSARPRARRSPASAGCSRSRVVLTVAAGLFALRLPRTAACRCARPAATGGSLLRHRPYLHVLGFALLSYLCLQGPMGMFALYVRAHGGSAESVSWMWIAMLLVEIPLIALSGQTLTRIGPRGLLAIGVLAGGLRWTVCGFTTDLRWVYLVSLLHGVTVTGLVVGAPLYVEAVVPERLRSTGQGILAMVGAEHRRHQLEPRDRLADRARRPRLPLHRRRPRRTRPRRPAAADPATPARARAWRDGEMRTRARRGRRSAFKRLRKAPRARGRRGGRRRVRARG